MARANTEHTVFLGHQATDDEEIIVPLPKTKASTAARYQHLDERMVVTVHRDCVDNNNSCGIG
jgi:hypothetical protein